MTIEYLRSKENKSILWHKIDPKVRFAVRVLNEAGINTIASCEGHHGINPWVNCELESEDKIAKALHDAGARGFSVKKTTDYISPKRAHCYLEIVFWNQDCLPKGDCRGTD